MMYYDKRLRLCGRHTKLLLLKHAITPSCRGGCAHHVPVVIDAVEGEVHERVGEALVEPEIVPPLHRHHVPEPLSNNMRSK